MEMNNADTDFGNCVVYPRAAVDTSSFDELNKTIVVGDIAFVERVAPSKRRVDNALHKHVRIFTMDQVNAKFATTLITTADGEVPTGKELFDRFSLDGIVNAMGGEMGEHTEFGEYVVAYTAVMGHCHFSVTAEEGARVKVGDLLHIGLHVVEREPLPDAPRGAAVVYKLQLFRFFDKDVTRSDLPTGLFQMLAALKVARLVGAVVATSTDQGAPSVTINIDIDPLAEVTETLLRMNVDF